jgi:cytochrome d ubiquinol oxidase subunit I
VCSIPLPWVAAEMGWIVAEVGRQPWVIEGVLPTAVAVSNLGAATVLGTIVGFVAIYTTLLVIEMKLMLKAIRKGPTEHPPTPAGARRAGAGPDIAGRPRTSLGA